MGNKKRGLVGTTVVGRYRVERRLGEGGMGAIYLATQVPLGRKVVLKVLLDGVVGDDTAVRRFEKEAVAISRIVHPHIVTLYDFGRTQTGELFIAMEYLPGESLRELLLKAGHIPAPRALHIIEGIAQGLAEAHRHGIIHRDLKPENIMLVRAGDDVDYPKVLDFGLAHNVEAEGDKKERLTHKNMIPGTPCYISPERALGEEEDARSDLYALGAMWYELLCGEPPFQGDSPVRTIVLQIQEMPIPPSRRFSGLSIPPWQEALLMRLLEKRPDDRPSSARALVREIKETMVDGWSASSPGIPGGHQRDELAEWAEDVPSEIPDVAFAEFLGFDDEAPVLLTHRKQPPAEKGFVHTLTDTKAPMATSSLPPQDTEEVSAILLSQRKQTPGAGSERDPIESVALAAMEMARATSIDEVAAIICAFLKTKFSHGAVLDLLAAPPVARARFGYTRTADVVGVLLSTRGFGDLVSRKEPFYGPPPRTTEWSEAFTQLGHQPEAMVCAVLRRATRPAVVIFAAQDHPELHAEMTDVQQILKEAAACLSVLER